MNTGCKKLASNSSVVSFGRQEQPQNPPLGGGLEKHRPEEAWLRRCIFCSSFFRQKNKKWLSIKTWSLFGFSVFHFWHVKFLTLHLYYPRMKLLPPPVPVYIAVCNAANTLHQLFGRALTSANISLPSSPPGRAEVTLALPLFSYSAVQHSTVRYSTGQHSTT